MSSPSASVGALRAPRRQLFTEIGRTGLRRTSTLVQEDFLRALQGREGIKVYREMRDNDPIIGASALALEQTLRKVRWHVKKTGETNLERRAADFLSECTEDMEQSWEDLISDITTMFTFGFAPLEVVMKVRRGDNRNPKTKSKFNDGLIGWRKLSLRMQTSLDEWEFDDNGDAKVFVQRAYPDYKRIEIPMAKILLFRTQTAGNNPEGRSIYRNAYRPWFLKKRIEEIEAVGVERDLIGLPIIIPAEDFDINAPENEDIVNGLKGLLYALRRDEQDGVLLPNGWELTLLGSGRATRRQFDLNEVINRYDKRIAVSTLSQAIMLGLDRVGSFALSKSSVNDFFLAAAQGFLNSISAVFNHTGVPQLFDNNPVFAPLRGNYPKMLPGKVKEPNLTELADYISKLAGKGFFLTGEDIEGDLLRVADLSEPIDKKTRVIDSKKMRTKPLQTPQSPNPNSNPNSNPNTDENDREDESEKDEEEK